MIVGITGGSGCGKTTALKVFEQCGGIVMDCDQIYHRLLRTDKALLDAIDRRFPDTVVGGLLDRIALGNIVFADPQALADLNAITHSAVRKEVLRRLDLVEKQHAAIDAVGLFEGDLAKLCNVTVAVTAPENKRIDRLMVRDAISLEYAQKRIAAQRSQEEFCQLCDYTLANDGTEAEFADKCLAFFKGLGIMEPIKKDNC